MRRAQWRLWLAVGLAFSTATLTACSGSIDDRVRDAGADLPVRDVDFDFEHQAADIGSIVPGVTNQGTATVEVSVAVQGAGRATLADGVEGGFGLRFPAFDSDGPVAVAAVVVRPREVPDVLSPADRDFRFGADFAVDEISSGGARDNGDNLVQRGLSADADQYKIQVDHHVPSCRVAGEAGTAFVKSDVVAVPGRWYRVSCRREADRLVLTVAAWSGSRWGAGQVSAVTAATGRVDFADSDAPLAIGAKVDADGTPIASASDQFNGVVDNVFFELLP